MAAPPVVAALAPPESRPEDSSLQAAGLSSAKAARLSRAGVRQIISG
jgi:hypothetical protein